MTVPSRFNICTEKNHKYIFLFSFFTINKTPIETRAIKPGNMYKKGFKEDEFNEVAIQLAILRETITSIK
jgi:hypothetical protein